jgi:ribosomal protein L9
MVMNAREFFDKVVEMRNAQKKYFETRDKAVLDEAKRLEKELDAEIRRVEIVLKVRKSGL